MSNTSNLDLERPNLGDNDWHTSLNSNFTKLDTGYGNNVASIADLPEVYIETGTFNYTSGDTITLPKSVDAVNEYNVTIMPTSRAGAIGDIYVTKTTSNFTVYCSSNNTTDTFAAVIYYIGDINSYGGSVYRRYYVSPDASITDHSDNSDTGSLANVLASIGASPATVELPGNKTYYITSYNLTINSNIELVFQKGAIINVASGRTLTINGVIQTGLYQIFDNSGTITGTPKIRYISPFWFGALGDGSNDDTSAIQDALNMASNLDAAASSNVVQFPFGTYKITSTLTWYKGTCIEGIHNSLGAGARWPEISWFGSAGGTMIETDNGLGNRHIMHIRRMVLRLGDGHSNRPNYAVYFKDRADLGTSFEDFQVIGTNDNAVYFLEGGINVNMRNVRFDGCRDHVIYWVVSGHDCMSIDGFTIDNQRDDQPASGGAIHFDLSSASNNYYINMHASNGKIEANTDLSSGDGFFKYTISPTLSQYMQVMASFHNVWIANAGGVTEYVGIKVTPDFDFVRFTLTNCWRVTIEGVPNYYNPLSSANHHIFTAIDPHSLSINTSPAAEYGFAQFNCDTNFHNLYQFGERMAPISYMDYESSDWDSNPVTVYAGQLFLNPSGTGGATRDLIEVTATGTLGTLSGVTGTGTSGTSTLTLNDVSDIKLGHVISIGSDTGKRIFRINPSTKVVTLHSNLGSSHTGAAVSFTAPTIQTNRMTVV